MVDFKVRKLDGGKVAIEVEKHVAGWLLSLASSVADDNVREADDDVKGLWKNIADKAWEARYKISRI